MILFIEGTSDNYNSANRTYRRSICTVVAMISDGKTAIPVTHNFWISEEFALENYKTKTEIAKALTEAVMKHLRFFMVLADGLYATHELLKWMSERNIRFEMKFHSNRSIVFNGTTISVKNHPLLQLKKTRKRQTIATEWNGIFLYITVVTRYTKNDEKVVIFQASNYKTSARDHERFYKYRWAIEKFFRTAKQKLGIGDCQARSMNSQKNHIMNVFLAYVILQLERKKLRLKNVETVLRRIRRKSYTDIINSLTRSDQIFGVIYA